MILPTANVSLPSSCCCSEGCSLPVGEGAILLAAAEDSPSLETL